jgi:hypothetical protein
MGVAPDIEVFERRRQPEEEAQLLDAEIGALSAALRSRE